MKKDPKIFLQHILDSIEVVEKNLKAVSENKFEKSIPLQDVVIRRITIIGEASMNLPAAIKKNYPEIDWRDIINMRNKLIHEYFGVDVHLVWQVVKNDIPKLKKRISEILLELSK